MARKIVILGGGFGGLYAARTLERVLPPQSAQVTLVNDQNFMLYTPLLPGAAAGTLEPRHVVVPLREMLKRTDLVLGPVRSGQPAHGFIEVETADGANRQLEYDQLVVALGSVSRVLDIPGLEQHALGFKTLADAIDLRNRVLRTFEAAEVAEDPAVREAYLTYIFVGAGYAGLEGLAELQDFAADVIELYPRCRTHGMRWILVEAQDRVMPEIQPSLAKFATSELRRRGIEIRTSTTLKRLEPDAAWFSDGTVVPTHTLAWTAGVSPSPVLKRLGLPLEDRGRIQVDATMQVHGHSNVWAIGDCAAVPYMWKRNTVCPPTAQHAIRQGRRVAKNVAASIGGGKARKFSYRSLGAFVDMGREKAVASTVGIRWRGLPAWFLARTYHLIMMPTFSRKARLVTDWTTGLLFDRDSAELGQLGHPLRLGDIDPNDALVAPLHGDLAPPDPADG